jgi:tRNA (cytidine/uridine-2'-O-)-methyltransferase
VESSTSNGKKDIAIFSFEIAKRKNGATLWLFDERIVSSACSGRLKIIPHSSFLIPHSSFHILSSPFHIVLVSPEIPQNTGTIGRLCVCTGAVLHLIDPLGFVIDDAHLRRAGLDYWPYLDWHRWSSWEDFLAGAKPTRMAFLSSKTTRSFFERQATPGDFLVFGNEQHGLPVEFYERYRDSLYTLPMPGPHARCHNLANAASIALYEALRQTGGL